MSERVTLATLDLRLDAFDQRLTEFGTAMNQIDGKLDLIMAEGLVRRIVGLETYVEALRDRAIISKVEGHEKFKWVLLSALLSLGAGLIITFSAR